MSAPPPGWHEQRWAPPAAKPPHPTLPAQVAWGGLATIVASLIGGRIALDLVADQGWPIAVYVVLLTVVSYGPPLLFWRMASHRWGSGNPRADIGLHFRAVDTGWGPVTWLAALAAQIVVGIIVVNAKVPFQNNTDQIRDARDDPGYIIPILIVAVVAAPIVEEILFRGLVMRGLLSVLRPWMAVGLQGVLFGAAHIDPVRGVRNLGLVMVLSGVGVVLGGSAYLLRRLPASMIAHAIMNGIAMAIVLSGWTPDPQ